MNGNGWGMDGIHAPQTTNQSETILGFCTSPALCDCVRIIFLLSGITRPFSKKMSFGCFGLRTIKFECRRLLWVNCFADKGAHSLQQGEDRATNPLSTSYPTIHDTMYGWVHCIT